MTDAVRTKKLGPERELTDETRITTFKDLEIHLVAGPEAPGTLDEIGRIREREYRAVGAGRGGDLDLDRFDTEWPWYYQLVSWDRAEREIVAMYRAIHCGWAIRHGGIGALRTAGLFAFSDRFVADYLMHAIELGRSVVNRSARRAIQGLFSVWAGLGALLREWSDVGFFFGNVSLYRSLPPGAIERILDYLARYHAAEPGLVTARTASQTSAARRSATERLSDAAESDRAGTLEELLTQAAGEGWPFPPILLSYLKANPGLLAFDAAEDEDFGGAIEVAIAVPVTGLSRRTHERFLEPYRSSNPGRFVLPASP